MCAVSEPLISEPRPPSIVHAAAMGGSIKMMKNIINNKEYTNTLNDWFLSYVLDR